ncbi:MAG: Fic family protein [Bacteroidetes bacterium]|nr:Fic family protein [Bacteroidota bacterium]
MATPNDKLAESLQVLQELQNGGVIAIRSNQLSRTHRERLLKQGFLKEVMKGWYIPAGPDELPGDSTSWYASFWHFAAEYLHERFGNNWSISPEQSVMLHAANYAVPTQLYIRASGARNHITELIHGTSLLEIRAALPNEADLIEKDGLRLFSLSSGLINCNENFYTRNPTDARTALLMIRDSSEVLGMLLDGSHSVVAGRLAGAFRNVGRTRIADEILDSMKAAGFTNRETDPFEHKAPVIIPQRERSPYINRIRLMWATMREVVLQEFPVAPGMPPDIEAYIKEVDDNYINDAYNSLSIEGYRVTPELIEKVRSGKWQPDLNEDDRNQSNALAARGYWQAFQAVKESVRKILNGDNAGNVTDKDHGTWFRELFGPSVTAGILKASDLAGYRNMPVFIRRSHHTPPNVDAVRDLMPVLFEMLAEEKEAAVRVVLGHFIFVYIHPYRDGNGRIGRFLMNTMMASGGYPWTVVPLARRDEYMAALESASVGHDIRPFAQFLASLLPNE